MNALASQRMVDTEIQKFLHHAKLLQKSSEALLNMTFGEKKRKKGDTTVILNVDKKEMERIISS